MSHVHSINIIKNENISFYKYYIQKNYFFKQTKFFCIKKMHHSPYLHTFILFFYICTFSHYSRTVTCITNDDCPITEACIDRSCQRPCDVHNPCAQNAVCINTNHGSDCSCAEGYQGNGYIGCVPGNFICILIINLVKVKRITHD